MNAVPIDLPMGVISDFCRKNGIGRMSVFGSALRDDFTPASDIDFLVDFLPGRVPGLIRLSAIERELSGIILRKADLVTQEDLSRYFVDEVLSEAIPIYVAP